VNYAVLIPALNAEKTIGRIVRDCVSYGMEVLVVDDGSDDDTAVKAMEAGAGVLKHHVNRGKGAALISGFEELMKKEVDAVVTLDADGQHLPSEIPVLIYAFEDGKGDIIIGARLMHHEKKPLKRLLANRFGDYCISGAAGVPLTDTQSGFRVYSKRVIKEIKLQSTGFEMEADVLIRAARSGFRIAAVPVTAVYATGHKSHFRPVRDFYRISILVLKSLMRTTGFANGSGGRAGYDMPDIRGK
jgi:glycosyltransferase involved in cell wall biosynthesis